jgi:hypothetical protein
MNLIKRSQPDPARAQLRKYGLIMFTAFAVISGLLFLRHKPAWLYTFIPSMLFLVSALIAPGVLAPVEKLWMKLAAVMGFVMTNVLLTLVFVVAVIPAGLILQLFGKSQIRKCFSKEMNTYWISVNRTGPCSRPDKPY